jgi:hypothetical protein
MWDKLHVEPRFPHRAADYLDWLLSSRARRSNLHSKLAGILMFAAHF